MVKNMLMESKAPIRLTSCFMLIIAFTFACSNTQKGEDDLDVNLVWNLNSCVLKKSKSNYNGFYFLMESDFTTKDYFLPTDWAEDSIIHLGCFVQNKYKELDFRVMSLQKHNKSKYILNAQLWDQELNEDQILTILKGQFTLGDDPKLFSIRTSIDSVQEIPIFKDTNSVL